MPHPKAVIAVSLAALVLLAGCGALPLGSDPGPAIPPGLSENGVHDASELASAHWGILGNQSRTVEVTETIRYENGSLLGSKRVAYRVDPGTRTALKILEPEPPNGLFASPLLPTATRVEFYRNATSVHVRASNATTTEHVTITETEDSLRSPKMVAPLLTGLELQYKETVERNGMTLYWIEATDVRDEDLVASTVLAGARYDDLRNVTFRALVTEKGLVTQYTVTYVVEGYETPATGGGQVVRGKRTVTFDAVGTTTVERPDWIGNRSAA